MDFTFSIDDLEKAWKNYRDIDINSTSKYWQDESDWGLIQDNIILDSLNFIWG